MSGGDQDWAPRGLPDLPQPDGARRHLNYWLGGWFGTLVAYSILVVFDPLQVVGIGLKFSPGEKITDPAPILMMVAVLAIVILVHMLGLRPRVVVGEDSVRIDNPLTRWHVPFNQIDEIDSFLGYARLRLISGQRIVCIGLEEYHSGYRAPQVGLIEQRKGRGGSGASFERRVHPLHWFDYISLIVLFVYMLVGIARYLL